MRVAVITPVGPGHEESVKGCAASVALAWSFSQGPFTSLQHCISEDPRGELGAAGGRNRGVALAPDADWYFFIDADDECHQKAFEAFGQTLKKNPDLTAVFGAVYTKHPGNKPMITPENVYPLDFDGVLDLAARGTLSVGCFFRADVVHATPWNETKNTAEDFDFFLRALCGRVWTKIKEPLVMIHRDTPSSHGPRGYQGYDWRVACQKVVDEWKTEAHIPR